MERTPYDRSNALVATFTADGLITGWNAEAERVFGWTREELAGKDVSVLFATSAKMDPARHAVEQIRAGAPVWSVETTHRARDGTDRVLLCTITRCTLRGCDDYVVAAYDITRRAEAEERLRVSEASLNEAQLLAGVGSWSWDVETDVVVWSQEMFRIAGREPRAGAPGFTEQRTLYSEATWPVLEEAVARALQTGEPYEVEVAVVRPDGEQRWIVARGAAVRGSCGRTVRIHGTAHDVTERRREHKLLQESEQRFRLMTEAIQDVFWMCTEGMRRVLYISPAYETIWGRPRQTIYDSPRSFLDAVHPEDRERVRAFIDDRGEQRLEVEYRIVRPDGSIRWIRDRGFQVRDEQGQVILITGVASDITELQHQREMFQAVNQRLERSERRYRDLIENLNDVVFAIDASGKLEYVSPSVEKYGYTPEALLTRVLDDIVHPADRGPMRRALERTLSGINENFEFRALDARGGVRHLRTSARAVFEGSRITGITGVLIDVTEQRQAEEQLRLAQRLEAVGRLAGGIAHDFNNLLVAIIGYAEFALDGVREGDPMRKDLEEICRAGERAAALTKQLLAFSRKQVLKPEIISLNEVVRSMEGMLRRVIGEDIEFEAVLGDNLAPVLADPGQMEQVIMNLVVNARDAMPDGGRLTIRTSNEWLTSDGDPARSRTGLVVLEVSDTGAGMDESTKARIFEPFFTTKPQGEGTGLGLATVYGIVRQSEGVISVDTEPGKGASFRVAFPRQHTAVPPRAEAKPAATVSGTETILIVEDEESVRQLTRRFLANVGYHVLTAANGGEALLTCERHDGPIHLLLTDVVMPRMSGRELADRLRPLRPGMKVLFMSGYSGTMVADRGGLAEGMHLIEKPFTGADLSRRVRQVLDGPQALEPRER